MIEATDTSPLAAATKGDDGYRGTSWQLTDAVLDGKGDGPLLMHIDDASGSGPSLPPHTTAIASCALRPPPL